MADNKTIGITIRLWTNNIKVTHPDEQNAESLACWECGAICLEANKGKGISSNVITIQCFEDILPAMRELLRKAGIVVVSSNRKPRVLSHKRKSK